MEYTLESSDQINYTSSDTQIIISIYTKGLINEFVKLDFETEIDGEKTTFEVTKETENNYNVVLNGAGSTINGIVKLLKNVDNTIELEINLTEPTTGISVGLAIGSSVKYDTKLTKADISNSVNVETLTEDETNQIMSKLMESKGIEKLKQSIEDVFAFAFGYDDEYDITCGEGVSCSFEY